MLSEMLGPAAGERTGGAQSRRNGEIDGNSEKCRQNEMDSFHWPASTHAVIEHHSHVITSNKATKQ